MLEFIHNFLPLWIIGALSGTGYILWAVLVRDAAVSRMPNSTGPSQASPRKSPQLPVRPAGFSPPSLGPVSSHRPAGSPEHQRRGSAPTVKLASAAPSAVPAVERSRAPAMPATPADDLAASELFSGLAAAKAHADAQPAPEMVPAPGPKASPKDVIEQAGRIEDYGFHIGSKAATDSGSRANATPIEGSAGQPRSQTQELDDILKRIDAVLSESTAPVAEATMVNQQPGMPLGSAGEATLQVSQPAPTEKTERAQRHQTDPNQQKLF